MRGAVACVVVLTALGSGCGGQQVAGEPAPAALPVAQAMAAIDAPSIVPVAVPAARVIVVSVDGAVRSPGVYRVEERTRVHHLLQQAGGVLEGADLSDINIAAYAADATTLYIPLRQSAGQANPTAAEMNVPGYTRSGWSASVAETSAGNAQRGPDLAAPANRLVNLNSATQAELETLPGVGVKTAEKIMTYRAQTPFRQVEDLMNISGIGEKKLEAMRAFVSVQ